MGRFAALVLANAIGIAALSAPVLLSAWQHRDLLRFFGRVRGAGTALGAFFFHQVHLTYSAITMAVLSVAHMLR